MTVSKLDARLDMIEALLIAVIDRMSDETKEDVISRAEAVLSEETAAAAVLRVFARSFLPSDKPDEEHMMRTLDMQRELDKRYGW